MHTHTVRTKFTIGDRVQFDSPTQRCSGIGIILGFTVGQDCRSTRIDPGEDGDLYAGTQEYEITLVSG